MKLLNLDVRAFGKFSQKKLDFSDLSKRMHVIYGSNEAGKSTSLRALEALLYGIHPKSSDNFLHPSAKLSVAAKLELDQGDIHHLVRRKGKKNSLYDEEHDAVLDPDMPSQWLGVSREMFGHMFALDQQALHEGGQSILGSDGDVGQALFSASVGQQTWIKVLAKLEEDAEGLFKARGNKQQIHQDCLAYEAQRKQLKDVSLGLAAYKAQAQQYEQEEAQLIGKEALLEQSERDLKKAERLLRLMPLFQKRASLLQQEKDIAPLTVPNEGFFTHYQQLKLKRDQNQLRKEVLALQIKNKKEQQQSSFPKQAVLHAQEDIVRLQASFENFQAIEQQKEACKEEIFQHEKDLQEAVKLWLPKCTVAEFVAKQAQALQYKERFLTLKKTWDRVAHEQATLAEQQQDRVWLSTPDVKKREHWQDLLEQARDDENLERDLDAKHLHQAQLKQSIASACQRLLQVGLRPSAVLCLQMPDKKTVMALDEPYRVLEQDKKQLENEIKKQNVALAQVEQTISALETQGFIPTQSAWQAACSKRDAYWAQLCLQWQAKDQDLFQQAMRHADHLAEQLYQHSDRAHQYAQQMLKKEQLLKEEKSLRRRQEAWQQSFEHWEEKWQQLWPKCMPLADIPHAMLDGLDRWQHIYQQAESFAQEQLEVQLLEKRVLMLKEELVQHVPELVVTLSWKLMVKKLTRLLSDVDQQQAAYEAQQQQRNAHAKKTKDLLQSQQTWQQEWQSLTHKVASGNFEVQDFFDLLTAIERVAEQDKKLQLLQKDQQQKSQKAQHFLTQVKQLHTLLSHVPNHPDDQMKKLSQLLEEEQQKKSLYDAYQAELVDLQATRTQLEEEEKVNTKAWQQCCAQAGVYDDAGFEALKLKIAAKKRLAEDLKANDQYMKADLCDDDPNSLQAECLTMDAVAQEQQLQDLKDKINALKEELKRDRDHFAKLKHHFDGMTGDAKAAVHAQNLSSLRAKVMENVEHYRRLKLAAMVLRSKIERYRQENQSEMLSQASVFFKQLTQDSFQRLSTTYDEKDHTTLVGVRDDDSHVSVDGMSTGTRDQLYLALRLGYLKKRTSNHESVPFILDDILVHFDDQRSHAAMQTLLDFS
ncbi:MAG: AAA family ATPase, partial [Mariprofundaceae bacterium]|nr:AAA family ATPase [Mariprofundaceae bacterium]